MGHSHSVLPARTMRRHGCLDPGARGHSASGRPACSDRGRPTDALDGRRVGGDRGRRHRVPRLVAGVRRPEVDRARGDDDEDQRRDRLHPAGLGDAAPGSRSSGGERADRDRRRPERHRRLRVRSRPGPWPRSAAVPRSGRSRRPLPAGPDVSDDGDLVHAPRRGPPARRAAAHGAHRVDALPGRVAHRILQRPRRDLRADGAHPALELHADGPHHRGDVHGRECRGAESPARRWPVRRVLGPGCVRAARASAPGSLGAGARRSSCGCG